MNYLFTFTKKEIHDILYSTLALGFIFSIGNVGGIFGALRDPLGYLSFAILLTIIIGLSFIPHELMHKFTAMKYGAWAQYEMWKKGLMFALMLAIITNGSFVFAAPGAVMIYTHYRDQQGMIHNVRLTKRQNGFIASAGVVANLVIAGAFLIFAPGNSLAMTIVYINSFLAMFNLLPIPPLDGSKVIWWSIPVWAVLFAASLGLQALV